MATLLSSTKYVNCRYKLKWFKMSNYVLSIKYELSVHAVKYKKKKKDISRFVHQRLWNL